jgi:hypothetical protein
LSFTPLLCLKLLQACDQCQSSRGIHFLTGAHCKLRPNTEGKLRGMRFVDVPELSPGWNGALHGTLNSGSSSGGGGGRMSSASRTSTSLPLHRSASGMKLAAD